MNPLAHLSQHSLSYMFRVEWSTREIPVGDSEGRREAEDVVGPAMASRSSRPSSASGPDMCVFSCVTKCLGLCRALVTSSSRFQLILMGSTACLNSPTSHPSSLPDCSPCGLQVSASGAKTTTFQRQLNRAHDGVISDP